MKNRECPTVMRFGRQSRTVIRKGCTDEDYLVILTDGKEIPDPGKLDGMCIFETEVVVRSDLSTEYPVAILSVHNLQSVR